jgi:uncharacterized protein with WD repeat
LALCGFKGLDGKILVWDIHEKKLVCETSSRGSSFFRWSQQENSFLTAITFQKLKVDNQINVFDIKGELLKRIEFKENDLLNADFIFYPG